MLCQKGRFVADSGNPNENQKSTAGSDAPPNGSSYDASQITVEVQGSKVILRGYVRSWVEREEAARQAWSAPGVTAVDNRITVSL